MLLAQAETLRSRLGYSSQAPNVDAALSSALRTATIKLQQALSTDFAKVTATDLFFVDSSKIFGESPVVPRTRRFYGTGVGYQGLGLVTIALALKRGFVQSVDAVRYSPYVDDINAGLGDDPSAYLKSDLERGLVTITGLYLVNQFVNIDYTAGFDVDNTDPANPIYMNVPDWLSEAAQIIAMATIAVTNPDLAKTSTALDPKAYDTEIQTLIRGKSRYLPWALDPVI